MRNPIIGYGHMASAGNHLAARAADDVLEAGGNAVDAGVAGGLVLGVVQSDFVNIAGVAPIMIRHPDGRSLTIDGIGGWPALASAAFFQREHAGKIPSGILRTVVPAAPSAWIAALSAAGTWSFADVAGPAIALARDGFAMHWLMNRMIADNREAYARWPGNAAIYLPGGRVPDIGERFVQSDLAGTLQTMADAEAAASGDRQAGLAAARAAFYTGDIAATILAYHEREGGLLRPGDLAGYTSRIGEPVSMSFADGMALCSGAYCQGPFLAQALGILDRFDWTDVEPGGAIASHRVLEAIKLSFADREATLGDPDHVAVPLDRLLAPAYLDRRRALIDDQRAAPGLPAAGMGLDRPAVETDEPAPGDTSYIAVVDRDGLAFSATPSDVSYSGPVVPGTGLVPSTRGSASWADPAHPSAVAPGKRPRLTPNPAIWVSREGQPMPFGTPGGDVQVQAMAQFLLNRVVFGLPLQDAAELPRAASFSAPSSFEPHGAQPGLVRTDAEMPVSVRETLASLGHRVEPWPAGSHLGGAICAVQRTPGGRLEAAADPRRPTGAAGR